MTKYIIEKFNDQESLAAGACEILSNDIKLALSQNDRAKIALSGGKTPSTTYSYLGKQSLPWERVDVFLGDERCVNLDNPNSNAKMIKNTLLLSAPGSKANFYFLKDLGLISPQEGANKFSNLLKNSFNSDFPAFDLIVLGLGSDGHTASLFPYSETLKIADQPTSFALGNGQARITLTHPILSSAKKIIFLVSGDSKQQALKRLVTPSESSERTPAKLVRPTSDILILCDVASSMLI